MTADDVEAAEKLQRLTQQAARVHLELDAELDGKPHLRMREGTPVTDGLRRALEIPEFAAEFAAAGNALAAGLRAVHEVKSSVEEAPAERPPLTFKDFLNIDLKIGTVREAERVPKSDKLLKLQVDLGEPSLRQIVAGIGKSFAPDQLIGKQITVVANLPPRKLMGIESHGMVLAAGEVDDLALLSPTKDRVAGVSVS